MFTRNLPPLLLAVAALLAACSDNDSSPGDPEGSGTLSIQATDAPFAHHLVEEALIHVDEVRVHTSAAAEAGFHTLYQGAPLELDLLELRDGVTTSLGSAPLPAGEYRQVRLRVASASLRLVNGNVYSTDAGTLHLTSQGTSGFKVFVDPPLVLGAGEERTLLLDFDLSKTFLPIPANDPGNATTYHLQPVIRAAALTGGGTLKGIVISSQPGPDATPVDKATVLVLPPTETDPQQSVAATGTVLDGGFTVLALPAGSYDVRATFGELSAAAPSVEIVAGETTVVELHLQ